MKVYFFLDFLLLLKGIFSLCNYRPNEIVVPLEDPIVTEVTAALQEWAVLWKQLYVVSMF